MTVSWTLNTEDMKKAVAEWLNNNFSVEVKPEQVTVGYTNNAYYAKVEAGVEETFALGPYR